MVRALLCALLAVASSGCIDDALARRSRDRRYGPQIRGGGFPYISNSYSGDMDGGDALLTGSAADHWGNLASVSECFWFSKETDPFTGFLHYNEIAGERTLLAWFSGSPTTLHVAASTDGTNNAWEVYPTSWDTGDMSTGDWAHVCIVIDSTQSTIDDEVDIYINGVSEALTTAGSAMSGNIFNNVGSFHFLGAYRHSPVSTPMKGYLDEFAIWQNVVITPGEIALMHAAKGHYDLDKLPSGAPSHWMRFEDQDVNDLTDVGTQQSANDDFTWFNNSGDYVADTPGS